MGHYQPYKPHRATITYRNTDHKRCSDKQRNGYKPDIDTHGFSDFRPHQEQIHGMGKPEYQTKTGKQYKGQYADLMHIGQRKIAHKPEHNIVES